MQSNENIKNNLAAQSYWDAGYAGYELKENEQEDAIKHWISKHVPITNTLSCFEIGCFPGRYLTFLGRLGYELNGIDLTPRVRDEFPRWLTSRGFKTGVFEQVDFLKFNPTKKFDIVCSFGFIEHFKNWEEIFIKHLALVNNNGLVIIETPNFRGLFQRLIHWFLDNENYKRHFIPAMNPQQWANICEAHGFEVIHSGFIGEFQFWVDKEPTSGLRKKVYCKLNDWYHRLKKLPKDNKMVSPYCGIIARKKTSKNDK